jgi:hypothetical protein
MRESDWSSDVCSSDLAGFGLIPDYGERFPGLGLIQAGGGCRELSVIPDSQHRVYL